MLHHITSAVGVSNNISSSLVTFRYCEHDVHNSVRFNLLFLVRQSLVIVMIEQLLMLVVGLSMAASGVLTRHLNLSCTKSN